MNWQLVYRQERTAPFPEEETESGGARFLYCTNPLSLWNWRKLLCTRLGWRDRLKLLTPNRAYACVVVNSRIASECFVTLSRCRHYSVEQGAAVFGPVWTAPEMRGQGLATLVMKRTMNVLLRRGCHVFYVDTSDRNGAMQKVIARCGFGEPVQRFEKTGPIE